mmetsp:Transcript_34152/g.71048  ORF Transcript_34152/g.71048 Transcript_34152/m.71048 type:complete len:87 (+) Transcript_34152:131-391(+)
MNEETTLYHIEPSHPPTQSTHIIHTIQHVHTQSHKAALSFKIKIDGGMDETTSTVIKIDFFGIFMFVFVTLYPSKTKTIDNACLFA